MTPEIIRVQGCDERTTCRNCGVVVKATMVECYNCGATIRPSCDNCGATTTASEMPVDTMKMGRCIQTSIICPVCSYLKVTRRASE